MPSNDLFAQLAKTNQSFNIVLKKNPALPAKNEEIQAKYVELCRTYEDIVKSAKEINPLPNNNRIKFIELAARLGVIQCKMNSMDLSPTHEAAVQDNDAQLNLLKTKLDQLTKENSALRQEFSSPKSNIFTSQLKKALVSWEKDKRNRQAAYYYNFACHSLDSTTLPSPELVKKSVDHLEKSSKFYAQLEKLFCEQGEIQKAKRAKEDKNEADIKISETKKLLTQLQLNHYSVSINLTRIKTKKKITIDSQFNTHPQKTNPLPDAVMHETTHPASLAAPEKEVHIIKRRHQPLLMPSKRVKKISLKTIIDSLTLQKSNEELVNLETKIFQEITVSLEIPRFPYKNYFYIKLINNVIRFIQPPNLNELTKLRLAEIVLYFLTLPENLETLKNKQQILDNENEINSVYKDKFPLEERLKSEVLREKFQAEDGLKSLFLSEIKTYYFKQKITKPNNESRKNFLSEIQATIESSIKAVIAENTLYIITRRLSNLPSASEHLCLTSVLQEFEKFYTSPNQHRRNWLEENNIPIKPSNPRYLEFLGKLNNLINLRSTPGAVRQEKFRDDKIYKLSFFPPKDITLTKEIFLTRIKEHLLTLQTDYVTSNNKYYAICNRLTQLITAQIDQHAIDQKPIWRPYLLP